MSNLANRRRGAVIVILALFLGACATNRGVMDVAVDVPDNPTTGIAVVLMGVSDQRAFELAPRQPNIPSLKDGQINNPEVTSRAFARKRNSYGKAIGDILLPEGRTVSGVTEEAIIRALRKGGYRVVEAGTPAAADAIEVNATINKFWAWFTPGFWAIKTEFEAEVMLSGNGLFTDGNEVTVRGYTINKSMAAGTKVWQETMQLGLDDLGRNLGQELAKR